MTGVQTCALPISLLFEIGANATTGDPGPLRAFEGFVEEVFEEQVPMEAGEFLELGPVIIPETGPDDLILA